jgi:hypothetical protein
MPFVRNFVRTIAVNPPCIVNDAAVLTPLLALAGLLLSGRILHRRWISREAKAEQEKDGDTQ